MECGTCGGRIELPSGSLCNGCWEVESRLDWYAKSAKGRARLRWYGLEPGDLEDAGENR